MGKRIRLSFVVALVAGCAVASAGETPQVRARLVADGDRVDPGGIAHVGVLLEMEPGWHVYWKNPGDSGLATDVTLVLPDGFEAGVLQWPAPIRFVQPGDLTAYGYEGSVLLAAEVRVPEGSRVQAPTIGADVSWLACRDVCVLGSASLQASWPLPVAGPAFERWRRELPGDDPPFAVSSTGGLLPDERSGTLSVWLQWPEPPGDVDLFPEPGAALGVSEVRVQTRGTLTRVDLALKVLGSGDVRPARLTAVVAVGDGKGSRRSWEISVPTSRS